MHSVNRSTPVVLAAPLYSSISLNTCSGEEFACWMNSTIHNKYISNLISTVISEEKFYRIESLLNRIPVPPLSEELTCEDFLDKIRMDKKQTGKGLNLVLLEDIGRTQIVKTTSVAKEIEGWLHYVQNR